MHTLSREARRRTAKDKAGVVPALVHAVTGFAKQCSPNAAALLRLLCKLRRVRVRRSAERVGGSEIRGNPTPLRCRSRITREPVIGPATSGGTRWLHPGYEERKKSEAERRQTQLVFC